MSTQRCDTIMQDYALNIAVNTATWYGQNVPLIGAQGWSAQIICTNGAAGTLNANLTNFNSAIPGYIGNTTGTNTATAATQVTSTISANGTGFVASHSGVNTTFFQALYLSFVPSSSGNIYISLIVRREST